MKYAAAAAAVLIANVVLLYFFAVPLLADVDWWWTLPIYLLEGWVVGSIAGHFIAKWIISDIIERRP